MDSKISKKILFILALVVNLGLLATYGLAYLKLEERSKTISSLIRDIESYTEANANIASIKRALTLAKEDVASVNSLYIAPGGAVDFLETVELLARDGNLEIKITSVETQELSKDTKSFQEGLRVRFDVEGLWRDVYTFVISIENLPYKVSIKNVSFEQFKDKDNPKAHLWRAHMEIVALKLK